MQFAQAKPQFDQAGIEICAISVDPPGKLEEAKGKSGAAFPFLQDRDGVLLDLFGLRHVGANPIEGGDIARPALILVDDRGQVRWANRVENYRVRPAPDEVLATTTSILQSSDGK